MQIDPKLQKTQVQRDQRPQHKSRFTELDIRQIGNSLELIGIGDFSEQKTVSTGTMINS